MDREAGRDGIGSGNLLSCWLMAPRNFPVHFTWQTMMQEIDFQQAQASPEYRKGRDKREGRGVTLEDSVRHSRGNGKKTFLHRCMMKMSKTIALAKVQVTAHSHSQLPFLPFPSLCFTVAVASAA